MGCADQARWPNKHQVMSARHDPLDTSMIGYKLLQIILKLIIEPPCGGLFDYMMGIYLFGPQSHETQWDIVFV